MEKQMVAVGMISTLNLSQRKSGAGTDGGSMITNCADVTGMHRTPRPIRTPNPHHDTSERRMPKFGKLDAAVHYFNAEDV